MRVAAILLLAASPAFAQAPKDPEGWAQHDVNRTQPTIVDPGTGVPPEAPGKPPSDAVVLFGGADLSAWKSSKGGGAAPWKVENGYFEVVKGTGGIETRQSFGDVQLHIEWMAPAPAKGEGQDRGNSGVFFGGDRYEVQVLDSLRQQDVPGRPGAALYGQYPPLVNASRPPGQWQAYDIVVRRAALRREGQAAEGRPASPCSTTASSSRTRWRYIGPATNKVRTPYSAHPVKLPIGLQDHNHPVRFRNVWLRELQPRQPKP